MILSVLLVAANLISPPPNRSGAISADLMVECVKHRVETMQHLSTGLTVKPLDYPWPNVKRRVFLAQFPDTILSKNVEPALKLFGYRPVKFATLRAIADVYPTLPNNGFVVAAGEYKWIKHDPFWLVVMPYWGGAEPNTSFFNLYFYACWDPTVWFMVEEIQTPRR